MGVNGSFSQCDAHTDRQMSLPEQCSEKAGHMQASQMLVATDALETFLFHEKTKPKCICVLVAFLHRQPWRSVTRDKRTPAFYLTESSIFITGNN